MRVAHGLFRLLPQSILHRSEEDPTLCQGTKGHQMATNVTAGASSVGRIDAVQLQEIHVTDERE